MAGKPIQSATSEQKIDDERVRVTRFDFAPAAQTGWHKHAMDYVVCAITDCQMILEDADGKRRDVLVPAGTTYRRDKGVEHNVINGGTASMTFVEIELK